MKKKFIGVIALGLLFGATFARSLTSVYNLPLLNETALAVNKNQVLNLDQLGIDYMTFTATFSSATIANATFTDGSVSTGAITVVTNGSLGTLTASDQITVIQSTWIAGGVGSEKITVTATAAQIAGSFAIDSMTVVASNDSVIGASITLNGVILLGGRDFSTGLNSSNTALSLVNAINSNTGLNQYVFASTGPTASTVIASATVVGAFGNGFTLTSSTPTVISTGSAKFSGGIEPCFRNAILTVGPQQFQNGVNIFLGNTSTSAASAIALSINGIPNIIASNTANGSIVFASATIPGAWINSYAVTSSTPVISVNTSSFTAGFDPALNNAFLTFNGVKLRAGDEWQVTDTSSGTATSIAAMFGTSNSTAAAVGSVVFATSTPAGAAGNSYTLTASTPALSILSANFTGGRDNALLVINGINLQAGTQWSALDVASNTARSISNAIQANPFLSPFIASTFTSGGVVTATSTRVGSDINFAWTSSTAALTVSNTGLVGGTATAESSGTANINIVGHKMTTGLPVLYSTAGSVGISPLTNQTTFFAIFTASNTFQLSLTSTGAVAGVGIPLTTQSLTGPHTFTLAPLPILGTFGLAWQVSNDSSTWVNLNVASVTFATPFTSTTTAWDLGLLNWKYLRAAVTAPTQGGIAAVVTGNGKH